MAREFFKNLPDTTTPLNAPRLNNFLNGNEAMGSIVVDNITCKNVLNYQLMENAYVTNDGTYTTSNYNMISPYISVNSGEQWTASVKQSINAICIVQYNSSKTFIKRDIVYNSTINTVTLDANAKYIRAFFNQDGSTTMTTSILTNLEAQLEKGKTKTNYVEHKEYENKDVYSTNEQVIGTWIDGKPLYRKVITNVSIKFTDGDTPEYTNINLPSNIKEVFLEYADVYISSSNNKLILPYLFSDGKFMRINSLNATKIMVENPTSYAGVGTFIVRYTKTTD